MGASAQQNGNGTATGGQTSSVLVSGASFAGLATAWWMNNLGYSVTVVEIARGVRRGGTPVNIRDGVIDVVKRMNLLERIISASLPPRPVTFLDAHGTPLSPAPGQAEEESEEEYEIERDVLLDMLFNEVKDNVEFLFVDGILELEESAEDVAVTFTSGRKQSFSLVFGCDGTHSAVRRLCFGEECSFLVFLQNYFSLTIVNKLLIEQKRITREQFTGEGWRTRELLDEMSCCDDLYLDKLCQPGGIVEQGPSGSGRSCRPGRRP